MARPSKLTPEIQQRIVSLIKAGNYAETAARASGIGPSTYYRWMDRGRDEQARLDQGGRPRKTEAPYREFWEAVTRADAEAEAIAAGLVMTAARMNYKAAQFLLERRWPGRWKHRSQVDANVAGGEPGSEPVRIVAAHVDPERAAAAAHDFLRAATGQPAGPGPGHRPEE